MWLMRVQGTGAGSRLRGVTRGAGGGAGDKDRQGGSCGDRDRQGAAAGSDGAAGGRCRGQAGCQRRGPQRPEAGRVPLERLQAGRRTAVWGSGPGGQHHVEAVAHRGRRAGSARVRCSSGPPGSGLWSSGSCGTAGGRPRTGDRAHAPDPKARHPARPAHRPCGATDHAPDSPLAASPRPRPRQATG